jgi:hypothetical protein
MLDPTTQQILGGGAVAVAIMTVLFKFKPWENRNVKANGNKSGDRSIEEWEGRMRKMHQESEEHIMTDMRNLMESRTLTLVEKVTDPIVKELRGLRDDLARRDR